MQRFGKQPLNLLVPLIGLVCFSLTDLASAYSQVVTDTYSQTIAGDVIVYLNASKLILTTLVVMWQQYFRLFYITFFSIL